MINIITPFHNVKLVERFNTVITQSNKRYLRGCG